MLCFVYMIGASSSTYAPQNIYPATWCYYVASMPLQRCNFPPLLPTTNHHYQLLVANHRIYRLQTTKTYIQRFQPTFQRPAPGTQKHGPLFRDHQEHTRLPHDRPPVFSPACFEVSNAGVVGGGRVGGVCGSGSRVYRDHVIACGRSRRPGE